MTPSRILARILAPFLASSPLLAFRNLRIGYPNDCLLPHTPLVDMVAIRRVLPAGVGGPDDGARVRIPGGVQNKGAHP